MRVLVIFLIAIVMFTSCRITTRTFKVSSPIEHISQIPIDTKEKGDIRLEVDFQNYKGSNEGLGLVESKSDIVYINKDVAGCNVNATVAITDRWALTGLYRYSANQYSFSANTAGGGVNYNLPLKPKKEKIRRDFDVFGGIQYRNTHNYMELNGYEYYDRIGEKLIIPDSLDKIDLANYRIHDRSIRYYIQPSFMLEKEMFTFYLGMAFAFQQQLKMDVQENILTAYMDDTLTRNPIQYYFISRGNTFHTEFFTGMGIGPEFCRFNMKYGLGGSSVGFVMHTQLGITSNLNIKKLANQRRTKKAAKYESLGPL